MGGPYICAEMSQDTLWLDLRSNEGE